MDHPNSFLRKPHTCTPPQCALARLSSLFVLTHNFVVESSIAQGNPMSSIYRKTGFLFHNLCFPSLSTPLKWKTRSETIVGNWKGNYLNFQKFKTLYSHIGSNFFLMIYILTVVRVSQSSVNWHLSDS